MSVLWFSVLILVFAYGQAGDSFLASNAIADLEQLQNEQENDQQSQSEEIAKKSVDKATDEGSPLELTTEDGLIAVSSKSGTEPTDSIPNGNMDGAMGLLRQRLASEEQFNQRLQQLLAKSSSDTRNKQGQVVVLQEQLAVAMQSQQNVKSAVMKKMAAENTELAEQRSRTKTIKDQLRNAGHMIDSEHRAIMLLRERMGTVVSHLRNVTHIGKIMEQELSDAKAKESIKSHQLADAQNKLALQQSWLTRFELKAKLHEVQAIKASDETRLKAMEHQNLLLQQRIVSMSHRDKIFHNENEILRKQLRVKAREEQKETTELEKMKPALAEAQKTNLQLQDKYADSLKALLSAREDGVSDGSSLSSDLALATAPSIDDTDPTKDASLLMQLNHDSKRLKSMMSRKAKSNTSDLHVSNAQTRTSHEISRSSNSELALSHDSQGLTALLNRMSNSTEQKALK